jgi:hypothetical protein
MKRAQSGGRVSVRSHVLSLKLLTETTKSGASALNRMLSGEFNFDLQQCNMFPALHEAQLKCCQFSHVKSNVWLLCSLIPVA